MARRSAQSFVKRQKEMARKEKQAQKAQKRLERKHNRGQGGPEIADEVVRETKILDVEVAEADAEEKAAEPALSNR